MFASTLMDDDDAHLFMSSDSEEDFLADDVRFADAEASDEDFLGTPAACDCDSGDAGAQHVSSSSSDENFHDASVPLPPAMLHNPP